MGLLRHGDQAIPIDSPNSATALKALTLMAYYDAIDDLKPVPILVDDNAMASMWDTPKVWYGSDAIERLKWNGNGT